MNLTSRTSFLVFMAHLKPEMQDAINPYGPIISEGTRHVMASMIIKSVTKQIKDTNIAKELQWAGKSLFEAGAKSMSYDDDDFWPLHPKPWYRDELIQFGTQAESWFLNFGRDEVMLNPQPLPPHEQNYYGALLTLLADAVSTEKIPEVLRNIGSSLMKQSISTNEKYSSGVPSFQTWKTKVKFKYTSQTI